MLLLWARRMFARATPSPDTDRQAPSPASGEAQADSDPQRTYESAIRALAGGDAEQALDLFRLARHHAPSSFVVCRGELGALRALGRESEAGRLLSEFIERNPGHPGALVELAGWHYGRGDFDTVEALLASATTGERIIPEACNLLGLMLGRDLGRVREGRELLERAVAVRPDWAPAVSNLGWMLSECGEHERGMALLDDLIRRDPDDAELRLMRSHALLKQGDFERGWKDYGARHRSRHAIARPYRFPAWDGREDRNLRLLVYAEQGLGDHIMFASCVAEARARVGHLTLECHPKLMTLFRRSFADIEVVANVPAGGHPAWLDSAGEIDVQVAMGDLPGFFRARWSDFPGHRGYLRPDPARVAAWKQRLDALGPGPRIGLSWRGGTQATRARLRSLDADALAPLLRLGANFVSLQYGDVQADLARFDQHARHPVQHWQDALDDYDETAALVCALDGVVSVCTSLIHLCGALGRHAWVLVPCVAEWRYLAYGSKLPWYPSIEMLRQTQPDDWAGPVRALLARLGMRFHTLT